jgi:bZIP transcription factor
LEGRDGGDGVPDNAAHHALLEGKLTAARQQFVCCSQTHPDVMGTLPIVCCSFHTGMAMAAPRPLALLTLPFGASSNIQRPRLACASRQVQRRMRQNREAARRSRQRKKAQMDALVAEVLPLGCLGG